MILSRGPKHVIYAVKPHNSTMAKVRFERRKQIILIGESEKPIAKHNQEMKRRWSLSNIFTGKKEKEEARRDSTTSVDDSVFGFGGEFGTYIAPPPERRMTEVKYFFFFSSLLTFDPTRE